VKVIDVSRLDFLLLRRKEMESSLTGSCSFSPDLSQTAQAAQPVLIPSVVMRAILAMPPAVVENASADEQARVSTS
jgi:hypothetical protein